jgi:hypothetical protein
MAGKPVVPLNYPSSPSASDFVKTSTGQDDAVIRLNFRLRAILENLMTQEQARMAASLPGTAKDVAETTGFEEDRVQEELDALFFYP